VVLVINSLRYDENEDFTVDRPNRKITWIFTSANNGFDILPEFEIKAMYFAEPEDMTV
jgi:hypothetical protein